MIYTDTHAQHSFSFMMQNKKKCRIFKTRDYMMRFTQRKTAATSQVSYSHLLSRD